MEKVTADDIDAEVNDGSMHYSSEFYYAYDVDALLADVRRLVDEAKLLIESAEDSHSHCDCYEVATLLKCSRDTEKAIAAVERRL